MILFENFENFVSFWKFWKFDFFDNFDFFEKFYFLKILTFCEDNIFLFFFYFFFLLFFFIFQFLWKVFLRFLTILNNFYFIAIGLILLHLETSGSVTDRRRRIRIRRRKLVILVLTQPQFGWPVGLELSNSDSRALYEAWRLIKIIAICRQNYHIKCWGYNLLVFLQIQIDEQTNKELVYIVVSLPWLLVLSFTSPWWVGCHF